MKGYIEIFGTMLGETDLAIFVDFVDKKVWLPKSMLEDWPDVGDSGEVLMQEWLAEEKELI